MKNGIFGWCKCTLHNLPLTCNGSGIGGGNGNGNSSAVQVYPEQLLGKIAKKAFATLGCSADEFFEVIKQSTDGCSTVLL